MKGLMRMKQKMIFLIAIFTLILLLSSCGDKTQDEVVEEPEPTPTITPTPVPDRFEVMEEDTGLEFIDRVIRDSEMKYTIEYQRNLVGNIYLDKFWGDIFESNGKIYVIEKWWHYIEKQK